MAIQRNGNDITVTCDRCGMQIHYAASDGDEMYDDLAAKGWSMGAATEMCPDCVKIVIGEEPDPR
jgi:hypothetical protein